MTRPVDARGARGVQAGEHGTQINVYVSESAEVAWPVRVGVVPALADCYQGGRRESAELAGSTAATRVLSGLGGVGKSQLAAAHARGHAEADLVLWLTASGRDSVLAGYAQAAREIGRAVPAEAEAAADWFRAWLQRTERRWLVVLDDLSNPADVRGLWPDGPCGHTVVTTRRRDAVLAARGRHRIEVGLFTPEEARGFLAAKLADPRALDQADELARDLGYLPLALAQAAAFILDRDDTCAGYRERFAERRGLDELFPADALADDYRSTVAATWSLSIEAADELAPRGLAAPLLRVCAVLDPNGFPPELVESEPVARYLGEDVSVRDCHDALRNLARLNLVGIDTDGVRMHALVQRAVLERTEVAGAVWAAADGLVQIWPDVERDHRLAEVLRANAEALVGRGEDLLWRPRAHPLLARLAGSMAHSGHAHKAVRLWRRQLRHGRRALGADHPDVLDGRHGFASALGAAGDAAGAAAALADLLADRERVLGRDHPDTLMNRASLARWRGRAGDPRGAADTCRELVTDRTRILGPDHRETLLARGSLARWEGDAGDGDGAVAAYRELLVDVVRTLGPDHRDTFVTRSRLARWLGITGDPAGAVAEFGRLVADSVRVLGPDHVESLGGRLSLEHWRSHAGDPVGAADNLTELVADMTRVLGPDHRDTHVARHEVASCRGRAGDAAGAVDVLTELAADRRALLGPDHPDTLRTERDLAEWIAKARR